MNRRKPIKTDYFAFLRTWYHSRQLRTGLYVTGSLIIIGMISDKSSEFSFDTSVVVGWLLLVFIPIIIGFVFFWSLERLTGLSALRGVEWVGRHTLLLIDKAYARIQVWRGIKPGTSPSTNMGDVASDSHTTPLTSHDKGQEEPSLSRSEPVFSNMDAEPQISIEPTLKPELSMSEDLTVADFELQTTMPDEAIDDKSIEKNKELPAVNDELDNHDLETEERPDLLEEAVVLEPQEVPLEQNNQVSENVRDIPNKNPLADLTGFSAGVLTSDSNDTLDNDSMIDALDLEETDFATEDVNANHEISSETNVSADTPKMPNSLQAFFKLSKQEKLGFLAEHAKQKLNDTHKPSVQEASAAITRIMATKKSVNSPPDLDADASKLLQAEQAASNILAGFTEKLSHISVDVHEEDKRQVSAFQSPNQLEYQLPGMDLLQIHEQSVHAYSADELEDMSRSVERVLKDYKIIAEVKGAYPGPIITRFELSLAAGVKVSRVSGLAKDLARALLVTSVRVVEIIEGTPYIGLEIPNQERELVAFREIVASEAFQVTQSPITLALGKDVSGQTVVADLAKMPHLLVAGTTGSGKSVAINTMILSILYKATPEQVRLIMVDPKMLELSVYEGIPHLLTPVVTDMKEAQNALRWAVAEMERRYKLMSKVGVRNLAGFNEKVTEAEANGEPLRDPLFQVLEPLAEGESWPTLSTLPSIVIVIDELADMMMIVGKKVEELIARLAQKARAAGIHLVLATQRPSVDVLTGLIKANVPTRISFQVSSRIDSRTILDQGGAEALLGNGDMLFLPSGTSVPIRAHGAFVADEDVHAVVDFLKTQGSANYIEEILKEEPTEKPANHDDVDDTDIYYGDAVDFVIETGKASISSVQRRFKVGYNRAARMIDQMEAEGIVSEPEGNGSRRVLNKDE